MRTNSRKSVNKKGMLLKTTTGTVIAIIGLLLIGWVIYKIYGVLNENEETQQAKHFINILKAKINNLPEDNETRNLTLQTIFHDGWYLAGWSNLDKFRPNQCFFSNCICVCKNIYGEPGKVDGGKCQDRKNGFCERIDRDVEVSMPIQTILRKSDGTILSSRKTQSGVIPVSNEALLMELQVAKNKDNVRIYSEEKTQEIILREKPQP